MRVQVNLKGVTGMVCHNIELADPQNPISRAIKDLTSKRKKTEADERAISDLEWRGGLYYDASENGKSLGPYCPTNNVKRCFQEGGKVSREGTAIRRAFHPINDKTAIVYSGPREVDELSELPEYRLRLSVGMPSGGVVLRTRPIFRQWALSFDAMLLEDMLNLRDLERIAELAGQIEGLNDARSIGYGRFTVTVKEIV